MARGFLSETTARPNNVELDVVLLHDSGKAWKVSNEHASQVWVPHSLAEIVEDESPAAEHGRYPRDIKISMSEGLAKDKGLI